MMALVLAGCRSGRPASARVTRGVSATDAPRLISPPAPTETPTATATALPTATLSPMPTATPTATATPLPAARLARGRYLQSIGDCAAARREFADLIAALSADAEAAAQSPADRAGGQGQGLASHAQDASEARFRLARCYLRDDAPAEASAVLAQLLATAAPDNAHRAPATFLLGEAMMSLSRWRDAEESYLAYLPLAPELSYLTWQRIALARRALGDLAGATEAYAAALKVSPDYETTAAGRRGLADLALAQRDPAAAVVQYDALRGAATTGALAAELQWLAGAALAGVICDAAGVCPFSTPAPAEALARWQAAADADPTSRYAHRAIVALLDAGIAVDEYQRGLVNYHNGVYLLAIRAFERFRAAPAAGSPRGTIDAAIYYTGLSYLALGEPGRGIAELDNLIAAYPLSAFWNDAWLAKARGHARSGDAAAAIAAYRRFAALRPDASQAPRALWQAALLEAEKTGALAAAPNYLALARRYGSADEAWRSYQAAGLAYFRAGDWPAAIGTWDEMAQAAGLAAWTRPVAYFWLGRSRAAAGDLDAARRAWQAAVAAGPGTYYGLRAADWLREPTAGRVAMADPAQGARGDQPAGAGQEAAQLAVWLAGWAGQGTLALPAAVLADPDWRRGEMLLQLGRRSQALAAWARVQRRHAAAPWALAALALAFRDAGANQLAILAAEELAARQPGGMAAAPLALQRLAYPIPYESLIWEEAAHWRLDPRLMAALIRQESRFEPGATSSASAQGLMQIMPATAQWIAGRLPARGYAASQAYWPYVNVAFGAYYLRFCLDQLDASLAAALAGYNGGPGNAARWRRLAPEDDDLMTALIDISETRNYVQLVLMQYAEYRRLYP
jgi:soluble lytic murein transglycosylase